MKFWLVQCDTDIDQYEYISLHKPTLESYENSFAFSVKNFEEMWETFYILEEITLFNVSELDGLIPILKSFCRS
jgi:hypothetical protein